MRLSLFALAAIALVVNGTPALSERITNKNEFVEKVAGKRLTLRNRPTSVPKGWMTIEADGRISGQTPNLGVITGSWKWTDGLYCRNVIANAVALPSDCMTVSVRGKQAIFTRHLGNGLSTTWTIE